jgi:HAD superfamily hydrolase (TIGR01509 family)
LLLAQATFAVYSQTTTEKLKKAAMQFQYIFWDNDGVLVDTERYYLQASREALARVDIPLSDAQFAEISLNKGQSLFGMASDRGVPEEKIGELKTWREQRYAELLEQGDLAQAGVEEVLCTLYGKIRMSIVTSSQKHHFDIIHKRTGFLKYFDFCLTREDYIRSKPSAEPYLLATKKSRQSLQDVLVIEDSPRGLKAAKAAGLTCWVIPGCHTPGQTFAEADRILLDIKEIPGLIL